MPTYVLMLPLFFWPFIVWQVATEEVGNGR